MSKRRAGSRKEVAAAAAGISASSTRRIDSGRLLTKGAKPRSRRRDDTLPAVSEVGAFYWTVSAPDIVNSGREEQGLVSV